jgi:hypothetical protein
MNPPRLALTAAMKLVPDGLAWGPSDLIAPTLIRCTQAVVGVLS